MINGKKKHTKTQNNRWTQLPVDFIPDHKEYSTWWHRADLSWKKETRLDLVNPWLETPRRFCGWNTDWDIKETSHWKAVESWFWIVTKKIMLDVAMKSSEHEYYSRGGFIFLWRKNWKEENDLGEEACPIPAPFAARYEIELPDG